MVRQTRDAFGRIDVLVNNAGIGSFRPLQEITVKEWDLVMDIDLRAPFICCQAVVPSMIEHGGGSIINVSSYGARNIFSSSPNAGPGGAPVLFGQAYGTAKAGLERFTWGLAAELGPHNIAVNALSPLGPVLTEGYQSQRPGADYSTWPTPEAMAKAAVFQEMPVHGNVLPIVERVLDPECLLSGMTAIDIGPGETLQGLHSDEIVMTVPRPHLPLMCVAMWALTDFTEANGGTRIVPGSHKSEFARPPDFYQPDDDGAEPEPHSAVLNLTPKAGDVVVIRYEGPKGGPGMREMLGVTAALIGQGLSLIHI